jgi:hypothetical protein
MLQQSEMGCCTFSAAGSPRSCGPEYPAELGVTLALRIMVHPTEAEHPHQLQIVLQGEDGQKITEVHAQVQTEPPPEGVEPGDEGELLIPWNFPGRPKLPAPGRYSMELLIDGVHQRTVPFKAVQMQ